ncbi:MAG: hypothetical protein AAFR16_08505 [Pseudomonadota bacterium]
MTYLAIVETIGGRIARHDEFSTQAEADAHVAAHGGEVVEQLAGPIRHHLKTGGVWSISAPVVSDAARALARGPVDRGLLMAAFRARYNHADNSQPMGALGSDISALEWLRARLAALDVDGVDAVATPEQQAAALDLLSRPELRRSEPLLDSLAPLFFGDTTALAAGGQAALDEIARSRAEVDQVWLTA